MRKRENEIKTIPLHIEMQVEEKILQLNICKKIVQSFVLNIILF